MFAGRNSLRIRFDLAEVSQKTQNDHFWRHFSSKICTTAPKIVFPIKVKKRADSPEDTRRRSISVALPSSPLNEEIPPKPGSLYIKQAVMRTSGIAAMPRSMLRVFDLKFLPSV